MQQASVWDNKKKFIFPGGIKIYATKAGKDSPRKFYSEVHIFSNKFDKYMYKDSYGSNMPLLILAVLESLWKYIKD